MTTENIYVSVIPLQLATDAEFVESVNTFALTPDMTDLNLLQRNGATAVIDAVCGSRLQLRCRVDFSGSRQAL
jgi:uncharacterized protein (DUF1501 family)